MAFSVAEFGLPARGPSLWRVSLPLTSVVLQLSSFKLPYSPAPYLYLRPYAMLTARLVKVSSDSCAYGRVSWSSSSSSSSWYSASHLPSESVRFDLPVAYLLQVFGFLGLYVLDLSVLFFFFFLP